MAKRTVLSLEAALKTKLEEVSALSTSQMEAAEKDNRALTPDERAAVEKLMGEARQIRADLNDLKTDHAITEEINRMTAGLPSGPVNPTNGTGNGNRVRLASWGEQWSLSAAMEFFRRNGHRTAASWRSPSLEMVGTPAMQRMFAATLTTDPASGGDLIPPDVRPGIQPLMFPELTVADLIASGTTDSNLISYMVEKTFTNAADTVAEGAAKPESALVFDAASDPVRKIAHWLPVTEEMLEDVNQIRSYIDARLRLGVQQAEDDQLLQGSGVAPDILGIRNRTGLATDVVRDGAGGENNADAIYRQIVAIQTGALVNPDGIVLNPANWSSIELMKDDAGGYMAGGPFSGRVTRTLWGVRVVLTPAMTAGVGLVGAFATAAQFFRKGGLRVEASNSHVDFFIKNLVAIRAEERGALAVYRPGAFGEVTTLA